MKSALVIGSSRGIGKEFVRQLTEQGYQTRGTTRQELEVTNSENIQSFAKKIGSKSLDLLVYNAGIYGPTSWAEKEEWLETFRVNSVAPIEVTYALQSKLKPGARCVVLSSKMGSVADNQKGGSIPYRSSKAALNAGWKSLSYDFLQHDIVCAVLHPGWVRTDMGGPNAPTSVEESVSGLLKVIGGLTEEDAGAFFDFRGEVVPW